MNNLNENSIELAGFEGVFNGLQKLDPSQMQAALVAAAIEQAKPASRGSRAEFMKYKDLLEPQVSEKVKDGKLQVVDYTILTIVKMPFGAGKKLVRLFEPQFTRKVGLQTLNNSKTEKDFNMIVAEIGVAAAVVVAAGPEATDAEILAGNYQSIEAIPSLRNGFLKLSANGRMIFKDKPLNDFYQLNSGISSPEKGLITLDNPKFILSNEELDGEIEMLDSTGVANHTYLMFKLKGSATVAK
jgi:hypothetical protein